MSTLFSVPFIAVGYQLYVTLYYVLQTSLMLFIVVDTRGTVLQPIDHNDGFNGV